MAGGGAQLHAAEQFCCSTSNVESPKFTSPLYASTVFRKAHRECPTRVLPNPQELLIGLPPASVTAVTIDPDVSIAIMKYGREGFGHTDGSELRHAAGSCARTTPADDNVTSAAPTDATNAEK